MKTCMKGLGKYILCFVCVFFVALGWSERVEAINLESSPYIMVQGYELSNEKIIPGEDFTLSITLKNYSTNATAKNVLVDVGNPPGIAPVYGTISQTWVESMGPGESSTVSFDYTSSVDVKGDYLDFYVTMVGEVTNYITMRVPVGSDSPFSVLAYNIPGKFELGGNASASVSFRVLGEENVNNVFLALEVDGSVISKSTVGILTAGATRTQSISMTNLSPGSHDVSLVLYYDDETNQQQGVIVGSSVVQVVEGESTVSPIGNGNEANTGEQEAQKNEIIMLGLGGILILCIFTVGLMIARRKK